jgi:Fe-S cluster assembly scaffold protein SufB
MTPLEQEELFYLQSRGLGEEEAKLLVLQGFMQEVLNKSELPAWLAQKAEEEIYSCAKGIFGKG